MYISQSISDSIYHFYLTNKVTVGGKAELYNLPNITDQARGIAESNFKVLRH